METRESSGTTFYPAPFKERHSNQQLFFIVLGYNYDFLLCPRTRHLIMRRKIAVLGLAQVEKGGVIDNNVTHHFVQVL